MTFFRCLVSGAMLMASTAAVAQQGQAPAGPPPAPVSLAAGLQRAWATIKTNVTQAADYMPAADFNFRTTPANKTYAAQFGHVANFHYNSCAAAKGVPNPNKENLEQKATKEEVVKALAESYAFCDDAYSKLTDQSALELVTRGRGQIARGAVLSDLIAHDNEEYGVITQYLRMKGIVPPSTANAEAARARGRSGN